MWTRAVTALLRRPSKPLTAAAYDTLLLSRWGAAPVCVRGLSSSVQAAGKWGASAIAEYEGIAKASYEADRAQVDSWVRELLSPNLGGGGAGRQRGLVLLLNGTVDAPLCSSSLNVVKMLTHAQVIPFTAVDVTAHPALLGYVLARGCVRASTCACVRACVCVHASMCVCVCRHVGA
eukprot:GHVU01109055.1.p1 GENE.GHVU01109055.1~~GHVU01109055.1.p1  ORF type:complete len:177 (-),score=15.61 GHVU01109055.1:716-1246(-)